MAEEEKMNVEDEESLEEIVSVDSEDELLESVAIAESVNVGEASLVEQLAGSLPMGTTRMVESSDVDQEQGGEMLEDVLRREWRTEDEDKKVGGNFYSGKKEDDDAVVYVGMGSSSSSDLYNTDSSSSNSMYNQSGGDMYNQDNSIEGMPNGSPGDFYKSDPTVPDIHTKRLGEVDALEFSNMEVSGLVKRSNGSDLTKVY